MKLLYISYFSIREPLVETQVISYLKELAKAGHEVWFLTFEPRWPESWTAEEIKERENALAKFGIRWSALRYHKRPSLPATMWDIAVGACYARKLARKQGIDVFHGRAHVASAMCALARWRTSRKMIFDIRGFNPEENVDAGRWKAGGLKYRLMKRAEKAILRVASGFVILTDAGRAIMFPNAKPLDEPGKWELPDGRPIEVIPCCVDLARFHDAQAISRDEAKARLGLTGKKVIAYVGALGGWYMTTEMVQIWSEAKKKDKNAFALIYTQSNSAELKNQLIQAGLSENADFRISKVSPAELAPNLRAADVALSLIKPTYSKISSSPTKFAEYLAAGCVVISTCKIGDCDLQIVTNRVGVIIDSISIDSIEITLDAALSLAAEPATEQRCFETANSIYSLQDVGGYRYKRLYQRLFH